MSTPNRWRLVATCARGLEPVVARELEELGVSPEPQSVGGVAFPGDFSDAMRANWRLRAANRVLLELATWPAADGDALYRGARDLVAGGRFDPLFDPSRSFAVSATSSRSALGDTRWIALRVKDGIVDAQRDRYGRRADVARRDPDLALRLRLAGDSATLLVDTSGEPLDRRGYRIDSTSAPLREQLAAAALLAGGWNGLGPIVDPMCGSGTLLAESAAIARGLAPNRLRRRWGFSTLPWFDATSWSSIVAEALPSPDPGARLYGCDLDPQAVAACRRNLALAGIADAAEVHVGDAFDFAPPAGPGLIAVNPPYGERLASSPADWRRLGDLLKRAYGGWRAIVFAGAPDFGKHLGLRVARRIPFWNGPLEGRILLLDLW